MMRYLGGEIPLLAFERRHALRIVAWHGLPRVQRVFFLRRSGIEDAGLDLQERGNQRHSYGDAVRGLLEVNGPRVVVEIVAPTH